MLYHAHAERAEQWETLILKHLVTQHVVTLWCRENVTNPNDYFISVSHKILNSYGGWLRNPAPVGFIGLSPYFLSNRI